MLTTPITGPKSQLGFDSTYIGRFDTRHGNDVDLGLHTHLGTYDTEADALEAAQRQSKGTKAGVAIVRDLVGGFQNYRFTNSHYDDGNYSLGRGEPFQDWSAGILSGNKGGWAIARGVKFDGSAAVLAIIDGANMAKNPNGIH